MLENLNRKLVKTYPGLPEGAGIYDDGKFYNCAPDEEAQIIPHEDDRYYSVNPSTGELIFHKHHPDYISTMGGLLLAGIEIEQIRTEEELKDLTSTRRYGSYIYEFITQKRVNRTPKNIHQKQTRAFELGNKKEAARLQRIIERSQSLGMRVITNKR